MAEAKDISLDPNPSSTASPSATGTTTTAFVTAPDASAPKTDAPTPNAAAAQAAAGDSPSTALSTATSTANAHGMSATSGPLGDHLAGEEFGLGSHDDHADDDVGIEPKKAEETAADGGKGGSSNNAKIDKDGKDDDVEDAQVESKDEDATEVLGRKGGEVDGGVMNEAEKAKMETGMVNDLEREAKEKETTS